MANNVNLLCGLCKCMNIFRNYELDKREDAYIDFNN